MPAVLRLLRHARLRARLRAVVALFALAAALAPGAAAVAEGVLADGAARGAAVAHIEDARNPGCVFVHPADCVLCGCVSHLATPEAAPRLAATHHDAAPTPAARQEFWRAVAAAPAPARAPPVG